MRSQFFCRDHSMILSEIEGLHHKDNGCHVTQYFGESDTEFKDMRGEKLEMQNE